MDIFDVKNEMKVLCRSKSWRTLTALLEDGYKGMFVILRIVRDSDVPVVSGDLAKKMNVSTARVAYALNTLESKKYVKRVTSENDARKVIITITETGKAALLEREKHISEKISPMLKNLSEIEVRVFFDLLNKLLQ